MPARRCVYVEGWTMESAALTDERSCAFRMEGLRGYMDLDLLACSTSPGVFHIWNNFTSQWVGK